MTWDIPTVVQGITQLRDIMSQVALIYLLLYTYRVIIPRKDDRIAEAIQNQTVALNNLTKAVESLEEKVKG